MTNCFTNIAALKAHMHEKNVGSVRVSFENCPDYAGMALEIAILFNIKKEKYELDLQWIALGLDLFGENLLENYLYQFDDLEQLLAYLKQKYQMEVSDIPVKHLFDGSRFPNPIKNEAEAPIFKAAWERFQHDFKQGLFLEKNLKLSYSTQDL